VTSADSDSALATDLAAVKQSLDAQQAAREKQNDALAIALGFKQPPLDPRQVAAEREKAAAAIAQRDAALREQAAENAVLRHAGRYGGNGTALADSKTFMSRVAKLDPSSATFTEDLGAEIRAAVESGPRFRTGDGRPANGSRTTAPPMGPGGASAGARQWTLDDVNRLPRNRKGAAQLQEAIDAGLLQDLGHGPAKNRR
jgi:hypothetical protein